MEYTTLGRTGLKVSVAGLGCGGGPRIGLSRGKSPVEAANLVRLAVDLGVNVIDTAQAYGTEAVVGDAIQGMKRDSIIVNTKHLISDESGLHSPEKIVQGLDESLRLLRTDYVDVFYLHALVLKRFGKPLYDYAVKEVVPVLLREKEKGKFRFLGITGAPNPEPNHGGVIQGAKDRLFDVAMFAFSMFNQNARRLVFPETTAHNVGTMLMFVVRNVFADKEHLRQTIKELVEQGKVPAYLAEKSEPLEFLVHEGGARSLVDAAYRYARHEPGAHVVLFGTSDPEHLRRNIASIISPPLPAADRAKIDELFGQLVSVGLDIPARRNAPP